MKRIIALAVLLSFPSNLQSQEKKGEQITVSFDLQRVLELAPTAKNLFGIDIQRDQDLSYGNYQESTNPFIEFIQKVGPGLWRKFIIQQYTKAAFNLILPFSILIIVWVCNKKLKKMSELARVVTWVSCIIFLVIRSTDSAMHVINPEYYAIRDILEMIFGR